MSSRYIGTEDWPWLKEHKGCDLQSACDSSHLEESRNLGYYFYIICDLRYNSNPLICLLVRFLGRFHRLANPSIHLLILFFIHVYAIKKVLSLSCAKEEWTASLIYSDEGRRDERKSKKVVSILSLNILLQIVCQAVLHLVKFVLSLLALDLSLFISSHVRVYVKKRSSLLSSSDTKRERSYTQ